jgi:hypothetical protein
MDRSWSRSKPFEGKRLDQTGLSSTKWGKHLRWRTSVKLAKEQKGQQAKEQEGQKGWLVSGNQETGPDRYNAMCLAQGKETW